MGLDRPLFPQESRIGSRITTHIKSFETPSGPKLKTRIFHLDRNSKQGYCSMHKISCQKNYLTSQKLNFGSKDLKFVVLGDSNRKQQQQLGKARGAKTPQEHGIRVI